MVVSRNFSSQFSSTTPRDFCIQKGEGDKTIKTYEHIKY